MLPQFLNKQGEVALLIASCFSELEIGSRVPNISELCAQFNVGAGTVQAALKMLEAENAIELQSRGHQGTTLEKIDRINLWKLANNSWICGAMPLPYTARLEGLATAFYKQFEKAAVPFNLQYIRGGKARIQKFVSGAFNFAICSKTTANLAKNDFSDIEVLMDFGPCSYMDHTGVVFSDELETEIRDGMKIGVDVFSYDHVYLNKRVCRDKEVTFIPLKYSELFAKLESKEIDASLWNWDELQAKFSGKNIHRINERENAYVMDAGVAVLVVRNDDKKLKLLLQDILNPEGIREIQNRVIDRKITPSY